MNDYDNTAAALCQAILNVETINGIDPDIEGDIAAALTALERAIEKAEARS